MTIQFGRGALGFALLFVVGAVLGCGRDEGTQSAAGSAGAGTNTTAAAAGAVTLEGRGVESHDLKDLSRRQPTEVGRVSACDVTTEPDGSVACNVIGSDKAGGGQYGGVRFNTGDLSAAELGLRFIHPEQISAVWVGFADAETGKYAQRWSWKGPGAGPYGLVFRPGQESSSFTSDISDPTLPTNAVVVFIKLKGLNSNAGFVVDRLRYTK